MQLAFRAHLTLALLFGLVSVGSAVAQQADMLALGETLLTDNCGACDAIGAMGESPHAEAPAFRTLSVNYPVAQLAEALAEGIQTGHPDMPEYVFSVEEIDAIIAWLEAIQEQ